MIQSTPPLQPLARPSSDDASPVRLSAAARAIRPYSPSRLPGPIDLFLDANEGPASPVSAAALASMISSEALRRYPHSGALEGIIAQSLGLSTDRVLVTAGGDDAIERACRACLEPGRTLVLPTPTFEMIARSARLQGAEVRTTPWTDGPYPTDNVLRLIDERTAMIAVVSPNNPTGAVATADDLRRLADAAPDALLLVDLAYIEFAREDLTQVALSIPNAVIVRTLSKAMGLASLRVGYAAGPAPVIRAMRGVGLPYSVSGPSLALAATQFASASEHVAQTVTRVRQEREELGQLLRQLGAIPQPSEANFVLARLKSAQWLWRALGGLGISVRRFADASDLADALRITCPGDVDSFDRLRRGLTAALRPQALLLDMDGVLASVHASYRRAIILTAASYGVTITPGDIAAAKAEGNANNDWVLTQRLLSRAGVDAPLEQVTARFERLYQGNTEAVGLRETESLIPEAATLERLARRIPLAIVTGRPRRDAEWFLDRFGIRRLFAATVCMEDAPPKPDPAPLRLALDALGVSAAWMVGDTPDDIVASRRAGVVPIGIAPPESDAAAVGATLEHAGAARVLNSLSDLLELLP